MKKESIEIKTYNVKAMCSRCNQELICGDIRYLTNPPKYPHKCLNGHIEILDKSYPCIEYK